MKLNNKGFALTSMIYMLIVLFLMIMLLVLSNLAQRKVVLDKITYDIKNKLDQGVSINAAELPYQNERTGIYYETLELAITKAESGATIQVLKNVTDQSAPTIDSGKSIKIDIAGKEVNLSQTITNNGTLDMYTSIPGGTIYNSAQKTFENNNDSKLSINNTDNTNKLTIINTTTIAGSRVVMNKGELILNNAEIEIQNEPQPSSNLESYIITNYGSVEINNSTLTNTARNTIYEVGIINPSGYPNSRIVVNSGTIKAYGTAIYNNGGTSASYDDPVIKIDGGTIISTKSYVLRENMTNSHDIINDGELYNENTSGYPTIYMNGKLNMTGGTIYAYNGSALNINNLGSVEISGGHIVKAINPITNAMASGATINTSGNSNLLISGTAIIESQSGNTSNVIYHASSGTTTIDGNALVENKGSVTTMTIKSAGKILVTGGTVKSNGGTVIINSKTDGTESSYGTIEVKGGTVETTGSISINTNGAYGKIIIGTEGAIDNTYPKINGMIKGSLTTAGDIIINSGTMTGTTNETLHSKNNLIIKGGIISSPKSVGAYITSGTITIGTNDGGIPSTTMPSITGKTYGVQATSGTINFYDGKIIGQNGSGKSIAGTVTTPTGYTIQRDLSGTIETAYLKES